MPNTWGIEIGIQNGLVRFRPDLPGVPIGTSLQVRRNDLVIWINLTNFMVCLISEDPLGVSLPDPIPPRQGSRPFFSATGSVRYRAATWERIGSDSHEIIIIAPPVA
jgi:hypothetical protein